MPFIDTAAKPWAPRLYTPDQLPSNWQDWLLDAGSLTARLKRVYPGDVSVNVLKQVWAAPTPLEQACLGSDTDEALIRGVLLISCGQPRVFARSVLPKSSLGGRHSQLLTLGSKPLGEYLFTQQNVQRSTLELAALPAYQFNQYLPCAYGQDEQTWGRRSVFYLDGLPILVSEAFLP